MIAPVLTATRDIVHTTDRFTGLESLQVLRRLACEVEDEVAAIARRYSTDDGTLAWDDARVINVQVDEAAWAVGELMVVEPGWKRELGTVREILLNALDRASGL